MIGRRNVNGVGGDDVLAASRERRKLAGRVLRGVLVVLAAMMLAGFTVGDPGASEEPPLIDMDAGGETISQYLCHPIGGVESIQLGIVVYATNRHVSHGDSPVEGRPRQLCIPGGGPG